MSDQDQSPGAANKPEDQQPPSEHLNIKVTDNNNEVFFKIKRTTALKKLMDAFCDRQGKAPNSVRFLFDGSRVQPTDSPESVSLPLHVEFQLSQASLASWPLLVGKERTNDFGQQLEMADGDTLEVHQEQIGGC
ncbi:MAG: hypothetical protein Q9187_000724 [Circinaria calcarea]